MAKSTRRLGRGLDALVPTLRTELETVLSEAGIDPAELVAPLPMEPGGPEIKTMPIGALNPNPMQPRRSMDEKSIQLLANSIKQSGLLQPITVRRKGSKYQIIAGERRWRAAQLAGLREIPVILREATEEQMLEFALIENLQREDLNPLDRATAYRQFCDRFTLKPDEVAGRVGDDRSTIVNYLRLLELPEPIRMQVAEGKILMGHARSLVGIADPKKQIELATVIVKSDLSVRALENLIRKQKDESKANDRKGSPHIRDLQRRFEEALKTRVNIVEGKKKGSGRMIIEYYTLDDFDRMARMLGVCLD